MSEVTVANWTPTPIGEVIAGLYDGPHATPKPCDAGPIFLGIKNVSEDGFLDLNNVRHISEDEFPRWTKRVLPRAGDIVFTYEATLNRYAVIPEGFRGCLGRRMALIRPDETKAHGKYLYYAFFGPRWRATIGANILSGSTVDRIPLTNFPSFEIDLPPLPIQKRIAAILSAYDDLIEVNTRRIAILEEMTRRTYEEWFVRYRFPGGDGTRPYGWSHGKLGDVLSLRYGKALKATDRNGGPVPVYGSSGVVGSHDTALVTGPGLVVGRKGNVGSVFLSTTDFYPIDTAYFVETEKPLLYVHQLLRTYSFESNDAAVPGLNREYALTRDAVVAPDAIMGAYSAAVAPLYELAQTLNLQNTNLRAQRDLLLPRLVSGKLDVSEIDLPQKDLAHA
ncbi:restriction endonuclease subunit S [Maricaulis maris]|uniref:Type I restriction enzyme S subunit n=1 Tax=Maricaulis maris TaxID=74318 RepID=A0A495CY72_9PROT|nr:restriction endonuclease subunit S [Maricaulis maris]RKQ89520.1 type I restriction enzyme S subunit [Maricaulis maris]